MKVSCCSNFNNPIFFGPHLWEKVIDLPTTKPTILIHGYHSPEKEAESSYTEIEKGINKGWLEYYWPGGAIAIDFPLAVQRATMAGWRMRDLLLMHLTTPDVQTHSLGARIILEALKYKDVKANNLILSAAAVSNTCFDKGGEFEEVPNWCKSINIFYSNNDPVLRRDFPLGSFGETALGLTGPKFVINTMPSNMKVFDYSNLITSHGGYRYLPKYYEDWEGISKNG